MYLNNVFVQYFVKVVVHLKMSVPEIFFVLQTADVPCRT